MALMVAIVIASGCQRAPLRVIELAHQTPDGPVRGYLATVDLEHPDVRLIVTAPTEATCEATAIATDEWATRVGATVAINANYFGRCPDTALGLDVIGLSVSDGTVVSPVRTFDGRPDPSCVIRGSTVSIGYADEAASRDAEHAVAGVGGSQTSDLPGTLLVSDGTNTGATARVAPQARHPRTAIGTTREGRHLLLVVVDGRQPDWSVGMTLPELADLLLAHGAYDAVNLDGGGSSTFVMIDDSGRLTMNRPSDANGSRAVANHLGVVVRDPAGRREHASLHGDVGM